MAVITCKNCGKHIEVLNLKYKYCSDTCGRQFRNLKNRKPRISKTCLNCSKIFITRLGNKKFCTIKCKNEYHKTGVVKINICKYCGNAFETTNNSKKYCSKEHYLKAKRKRDKEYYELSRFIK
ncbi:MAG: hypothetical protein P8Y70_00160 [Candidatus Lokiarchaeota archaeon]